MRIRKEWKGRAFEGEKNFAGNNCDGRKKEVRSRGDKS